MKPTAHSLSIILIGLFLMAPAIAQQLVKGEDSIEVPAMKSGLCVHNLFQTNMVLQRDQPIKVWGWADKGTEVRVAFAGRQQGAHPDDAGRWEVEFPAMAASSTPQRMEITSGKESVGVDNILIGDVWLLGGQSNMEHPISRVEDGQLEIMSANFPEIRHLSVPQPNGPDPRTNFPRLMEWHSFFNTHYRKGYWDVCAPESVPELSAIGYMFAKRIHMTSAKCSIRRSSTCGKPATRTSATPAATTCGAVGIIHN